MASAFAARATVLGSAVMLMHMVMAHGRVDSRGEDLLCAKLKTMPLPLCALVKNGTAENVDSFETMSAAWTLVAPDLVYVKTELYPWRIASWRVCCIASIARDSIMRYQRAVCTTSLKLQAGGTPDSPHLRRGSASSPTLFREWVRPDPPRHSEPAWCVCRIARMLWGPQHANLTRSPPCVRMFVFLCVCVRAAGCHSTGVFLVLQACPTVAELQKVSPAPWQAWYRDNKCKQVCFQLCHSTAHDCPAHCSLPRECDCFNAMTAYRDVVCLARWSLGSGEWWVADPVPETASALRDALCAGARIGACQADPLHHRLQVRDARRQGHTLAMICG